MIGEIKFSFIHELLSNHKIKKQHVLGHSYTRKKHKILLIKKLRINTFLNQLNEF